jgi:hypothetical protein
MTHGYINRTISLPGILPVVVMACLSTGVLAQPAGGHASQSGALDIGDRRQVFIDGRFLGNARDVELAVHPPTKTGERSVVPDRPWESGGIGCYVCVLYAADTYHMWYEAGGICYARSKDGMHWEKPDLGLAEFQGSRDNNIVLGHGANGVEKVNSEGMVFYDPTAPASERFRFATRISDEFKHTVIFSGPDGVHWRRTHEKVLTYTALSKPAHLDSQNVIFWDDRLNKYVAYMRRNTKKSSAPRMRTIARSESPTLDGFQEAQEAQIVIGHDDKDASLGGQELVDYYTSGTIKYPWAQDAYYMFPTAYFHYVGAGLMSEFPGDAPINAGALHTQFAASRDGIAWERFGRRPFVDLGMKGEFDSKAARLALGLLPSLDGRYMYMYYWGSDHLHGWGRDENNNRLLRDAGLAPDPNATVISRLVLRRDGFISARAAYTGGEFTTPPLMFTGSRLVLNLDTSATGLAQVGILDTSGQPIEGYSVDTCDRIHTCNEINRVVSWKGNRDLDKLAGKPVRLRFVLRDCDLYAFQFTK